MFDLETALSAWRHSLEHNDAFDADDLDELERHVRDQVEALLRAGHPEHAAFDAAVREMGAHADVEDEYRKVYWAKRHRRGELLRALALRGAMLRNYLLVTLRAMKRQMSFSILNVAGLAVGMAGCLLLTCYVYDELRYDTFHEYSDRIYRVTSEEVAAGGAPYAHTFPAAGPALAAEMPEVVSATRLLRQGFGNHDLIEVGEREIKAPEFLYVDPTFFDVFTVSFVEGTSAGALTRPNTAVITEDVARTYFGSESPIGHHFTVPNVDPDGPAGTFEIVGVVEAFPPHAHVHFDFLMSLETWNQGRTAGYFDNNWRVLGGYIYLRLQDEHAAEALREKLPSFVEARMGTEIPFRVTLGLQRLTDIHLHSHLREEFEANSDVRNVYILGAIAVFLLLIAGINFVNLATARSARRATEVGVRKVIGAHRGQLIRQFLTESLLLAGIAFVLALAIFVLSLPAFNHLTGKALTPAVLLADWTPILSMVAITLLVGLAAGSYPALLLSAFRPALVLKSGTLERRTRGTIRKGLVVTQFALSIGLMIATAVMYRQLSFMQNAGLGYDQDHVLVLDYRFREEDASKAEALRQELGRHSGVQGVAFGSVWPTRSTYMTLSLRPEGASTQTTTAWYNVDDEYLGTLGLKLLDGRGFSDRITADTSALIVNEAAVRDFGWTDPIGKQIFYADDETPIGSVVGVVRDFHYRSLVDPVEPVVLTQMWGRARQPIVRMSAHDRTSALAHIEETWQRVLPDRAFDYTFLDQAYEALYRSEEKLSRTIGLFALLALTIACVGLFGLAAFTTQQRTKEIGVRKVLGATVSSITGLLTMEFVGLIGIAFVAAAPLTYLAMQRWLSAFAYRIELGPGLFLLTGATALAIALLTVSYQSIKAAVADPVKSLRYE